MRAHSGESIHSTTSTRRGKKPFYLRTKFLFIVMSLVNLLNFVDRGVIPGATNEINSFIESDLNTDTPDVYLGLLQSSFIIGYMIGSIIFGHLIHHYGRFYLTAIGCSIWIIAVFLSGIAGLANSYLFLLFARILSGFGEAGLQCTIPPWIQNASPPKERGTWLAIFYTAIPVGTALGYAYSSLMAEGIGWQYAFFGEGLVMIPLVVFMFFISPYFPSETAASSGGAAHRASISSIHDQSNAEDRKALLPGSVTAADGTGGEGGAHHHNAGEAGELEGIVGTPGHHQIQHPTMALEFKNVMNKTLFLCFTAAYAAQAGALIGVSTFGSAFLMGLGFFDKESEASTVFGALISVAGIIATPVGGILLDRVLAKKVKRSPSMVSSGGAGVTGFAGGEQDELLAEIEREDEERAEQARLDPLLPQEDAAMDAIAALEGKNPTAWEDEEDFADREDHPYIVRTHLSRLSLLVGWASLAGVTFLALTYFATDITLYLVLITLGSGFIFLCNSAINMGVMLSVPVRHRSFAIALNVVFLHALGDVPSPILVGLLKDSLAPGCNSADDDQATDDGNIAASDSCRHDAHGLRVTMLITTLWLTWTSFFFFLAYFLNKMHFLVLPDCCCVCCDDGTELPEEEEQDFTSSSRRQQGQKNERYISPALQSPARQTKNESSNSAVNPMQSHAESASSAETNKVKSAGDLVSEVWNQEQTLDRDRVRILSADEYKVADSEEQRRSVERLKRFSREGSIDGASSSSPFSALAAGRLSGGSASGTTTRRSKSGVSVTSSAAASLSTNGGGANSAEPLYNRFREIEDTINI